MDARYGSVLAVIIALAVIIGVLAAHTQPSSIAAPVPTPIPTDLPVPDPNTIDILHAKDPSAIGFYNPDTLTVTVRSEVTFVNMDDVPHTALADNGAFNTGVLSPGQQYVWLPTKPGTYHFTCFLHPTMQGTIIVKPFGI